ncbi:Phosphatidylglycerol/phosphatidylinositol transfer protein [Physocladia obscura]|uniref:Phosphatidylglycerol/phosphatidylinositol transfer protein n=1 Tax=Physocladia obscura TaxID=109957 RepID=A0AAD5XLY9_9FUNG|nr:Phosphatidylglycerol/phosphatidylinositol transfer protein [Physocladia obscura]
MVPMFALLAIPGMMSLVAATVVAAEKGALVRQQAVQAVEYEGYADDYADGGYVNGDDYAASQGSVTLCAGSHDDDTFTPTTLAISPDPPRRGQPLGVTVVGELSRPVEEGSYIDVVAKLGAIKLFNGRLDLCEEAKNNIGRECPFEQGHQEVYHTLDKFPRELPPGVYDIEARISHPDGTQASCVKVRFRL